MKNKMDREGFTLVEILVAVTLITTIISMIYGSYFAASKSTQVCKARIVMLREGQKTLEQMAQYIRCLYAGADVNHTDSVPSGSYQTVIKSKSAIDYFSGNSSAPTGEILHLVTTKGMLEQKLPGDGLYNVTYKFVQKDVIQ